MKRPSFQFYPDAWTSNSNLRRCTFAERGIWLEVMCLLHDQDEYGVLRWPLAEIAEAVKCRPVDLASLVRKTVLKGSDSRLDTPFVYVPRSGRKEGDPVTLLAAQDGPIWYSSRMVRDEYVRTIRGEASRFGDDNGVAPKGAAKRPPKVSPKPPFGDGSSSPTPSPTTYPSLRSGDARAPAAPVESPEPTLAGTACRLMREAGLQRVNPSDPRLAQLLAQGVTPKQLGDLATEICEAQGAGKPQAYVLAAMEGRLRDAAAAPVAPPGTAQRVGAPPPAGSAAGYGAEMDRIAASIRQGRSPADEAPVIDVEARRVG